MVDRVSSAEMVIPEVTISASSRSRMDFSINHLRAAELCSQRVGEIERAHFGSAFGPFHGDILALSSASVIASSAALEAAINELFADRKTHFPAYNKQTLDLIWASVERFSVLDKFQAALKLWGKPEIERGSTEYQEAANLISLRNALVHFNPEWSDEIEQHKRLSTKLKGHFSLSQFILNGEVFPTRWAGHGCTTWALGAVTNFIRSFEVAAGQQIIPISTVSVTP